MVTWEFEFEEVPGQDVDFDKNFIFLAFWKRTKYRIRLPPAR
jgi:hypothetical protein